MVGSMITDRNDGESNIWFIPGCWNDGESTIMLGIMVFGRPRVVCTGREVIGRGDWDRGVTDLGEDLSVRLIGVSGEEPGRGDGVELVRGREDS